MLLSLRSNFQIQRYIHKILNLYSIKAILICLYLYEYLLLWNILYIIGNDKWFDKHFLLQVPLCKFNRIRD